MGKPFLILKPIYHRSRSHQQSDSFPLSDIVFPQTLMSTSSNHRHQEQLFVLVQCHNEQHSAPVAMCNLDYKSRIIIWANELLPMLSRSSAFQKSTAFQNVRAEDLFVSVFFKEK